VTFQACQVLADRSRAQAQVAGTGGDTAGLDNLDEAANGVEQGKRPAKSPSELQH
jgi:hypothetical protein